jgi:hypothetical protein
MGIVLFGKPEYFRCRICLQMHMQDIRKMIALMDHTNPLFWDEDGVAITNAVYTDHQRSPKSSINKVGYMGGYEVVLRPQDKFRTCDSIQVGVLVSCKKVVSPVK